MLETNRQASADIEQYVQRIEALEAELKAAHRLIADQQQILQSNLSAFIAPDEAFDDGPAESSVDRNSLSVQGGQCPRHMENAPIKLPDFGPPIIDIAQRVLNAAGEKGVVHNEAQETSLLQASNSQPEKEVLPYIRAREAVPAPPVKKGTWSAKHSLLLCAAILSGSVLFTVFWSRQQYTLSFPVSGASPLHPVLNAGSSSVNTKSNALPVNKTATSRKAIPKAKPSKKPAQKTIRPTSYRRPRNF